MRLIVSTDERFYQKDRDIYTYYTSAYSFWQRYLAVFTSVTILARVELQKQQVDKESKASGAHVDFYPLPPFSGIHELLRSTWLLISTLCQIPHFEGAYILRVPGIISTLFWLCLLIRRQPYAVEVVGDPYDSLSPSALGRRTHLIRAIAVAIMKLICRYAVSAAYVTKQTLQQRYPTKASFTTHYSSLELPEALISDAMTYRNSINWRPFFERQTPPRLLFVGSLAQRYKGLHILLNALKGIQQQAIDFQLIVLGDGRYRPEYEALAVDLQLMGKVIFKGQLPRGLPVLQEMCQADLLVMPSLMEGLPRAMLEAMACGLPCIGTTIGGIPELLQPENMVPPHDVQALAGKLIEVLKDPARLKRMSERNVEIAVDYRADLLQARRLHFYQHVAKVAEKSCR